MCGTIQKVFAQESFEEFQKKEREGIAEQERSFANYKTEVTAQYDKYVAEQDRLFKEYVGQIEKKWGTKNSVTSTTKEWVSYNAGYGARRRVDFEKGNATVEILVTENEAKDAKLVQQKLKNEIAKMVSDRGGNDPLEVREKILPVQTPILADQLVMNGGKPVTTSNAKQFAEQTVAHSTIQKNEIKGSDGENRIVLAVTLPLVPDHIKKRAEDFRERVLVQAKRFNLDVRLAFAIMHTESFFNPKARSTAPAFGLMQLVPRSGARDAYNFVYKQDTLVTGEYLYIPENNIELGVAYLALTMTRDFSGVENSQSRLYCTIAAYNTGPANVARTFLKQKGGRVNVKDALPVINKKSSQEVYEYLKQYLPYDETRQYVVRVSERMGMYEEWAKGN